MRRLAFWFYQQNIVSDRPVTHPIPARFALKRNFGLNRHFALAFCLRMIFSELPSPAEALNNMTHLYRCFAQAGNWNPLFAITR
jgi:hypothetical protein